MNLPVLDKMLQAGFSWNQVFLKTPGNENGKSSPKTISLKCFFYFFFVITEHTQVTPGLPMLQSFILTYIQVSNYFHCFSFHHRIHIWYVLYKGDIDFSKSERFSMRWVSPGKVSHNCDPI